MDTNSDTDTQTDTPASADGRTDDRTELAADDPRTDMAHAVLTAALAMDAVTPEQYDEPTPCPPMVVRDLLEHMVMVIRRVACAGRGESLDSWPIDAADVAEGEWASAFRAGAHDVQAAWGDDALLDRPTQLPWGVFSGTEVLDVYTNELTVHTWDLARATGQAPAWDDQVLATSLAAIHAQLPTADRTLMWEATKAMLPPEVPWEDPFANAVEVADDAPMIDRLVAWNGRTP
ncbi:MAG: TIGR03086 family metal-binding protein [Microthrixaceae bacterium]